MVFVFKKAKIIIKIYPMVITSMILLKLTANIYVIIKKVVSYFISIFCMLSSK